MAQAFCELREEYLAFVRKHSPDFETPGPIEPVGYPEPAAGKANLDICSAAVAEARRKAVNKPDAGNYLDFVRPSNFLDFVSPSSCAMLPHVRCTHAGVGHIVHADEQAKSARPAPINQ